LLLYGEVAKTVAATLGNSYILQDAPAHASQGSNMQSIAGISRAAAGRDQCFFLPGQCGSAAEKGQNATLCGLFAW
jgi:hypothetical protein